MLCALTIRDVVLIEQAELRFEPGLNVLTGETGAGKSILLDSLGFLLGWKVRPSLVRAGAERGEVQVGMPARIDLFSTVGKVWILTPQLGSTAREVLGHSGDRRGAERVNASLLS